MLVLIYRVTEMKHQLHHQIHYCTYAGMWDSVGVSERERRGGGTHMQTTVTVMITLAAI